MEETETKREIEVVATARTVRLRCRTNQSATRIFAALNDPEVVETLEAVGAHKLLSPKQKALAGVLAADEEGTR